MFHNNFLVLLEATQGLFMAANYVKLPEDKEVTQVHLDPLQVRNVRPRVFLDLLDKSHRQMDIDGSECSEYWSNTEIPVLLFCLRWLL